jgi:hypothetical protein
MKQAGFRLCVTQGCRTRVHGGRQYCAVCYRSTPEGTRENNANSRRVYWERKEAARVNERQPLPALHCQRCRHWDGFCSLGIPEGIGTFAEDCSAFYPLMAANFTDPNHPIHQQVVQDRLERAYLTAGRNDPSHPLFSRYTDVFGELAAKGIEFHD